VNGAAPILGNGSRSVDSQVVDFPLYARGHRDVVESAQVDFVPTEWFSQHTMRDALPPYVASKIPYGAIHQIEPRYDGIEVHGTYPEEFPSTSRLLGFTDVIPIPFRPQPTGKRHNYVRPRFYWATKGDKPTFVAAVTPGSDYVYHYADMLRFALASHGMDPSRVQAFRYPALERTITDWTGLNASFLRPRDRVIIGNFASFEGAVVDALGAQPIGHAENSFYEASRYRLRNGSTTTFLGVKYSYWGNISGRIAERLCLLGASEVLYTGKLGTMTDPGEVYTRIFMPQAFIRARNDRLIGGVVRGVPNRLLAAYPGMASGMHASTATIIEETHPQFEIFGRYGAVTTDNEISNVAAAVARSNWRGGTTSLSFVHYATDFVLGEPGAKAPSRKNVTHNLSTNRDSEALSLKSDAVARVAGIVTDYLDLPFDRWPGSRRISTGALGR
jgi:hypothetical protein